MLVECVRPHDTCPLLKKLYVIPIRIYYHQKCAILGVLRDFLYFTRFDKYSTGLIHIYLPLNTVSAAVRPNLVLVLS